MATIDSVDLYLGLSSARSGFNVTIEIYTLASYANDPDTGILLESKAIDVNNIPLISGPGAGWVTWTFDTPITVSDNDFAGIVFNSLGSNFASTAIRHYHAQDYDYYSSGAKAGTERCYISLTGNWVDQGAGLCLCYRINGTGITQNVADNPSASYEALAGSKHGFRSYVDGAAPPGKATTPTPTDDQEDLEITGVDNLKELQWVAPDGETPDYLVYFRAQGGAWVLEETILGADGPGYTLSTALLAAFEYYSIYEWRIDTYDPISAQTTTGDTWTFITQTSQQFTDYTRRSDYDADKVWQPGTGWVDPNTFEYTGGGRYKGRVLVVGHKVIYFGDL